MTDPKPDESDPKWIEWFAEKMDQAGPNEDAFFERRRRLGLGVGLDDDGNLVYAKDLLEAEKASKPESRK